MQSASGILHTYQKKAKKDISVAHMNKESFNMYAKNGKYEIILSYIQVGITFIRN